MCPSWGPWALAERAVGSRSDLCCPGWLSSPWWMPGATDSQYSFPESPETQRETGSGGEAYCLGDNTLPLGLQKSASGAVSREWHCPGILWRMTDQWEGKSPEWGGRSWVCYLWHLHRHTLGSWLFPPADGAPIFLAPPPPAVLFEKWACCSYTLECVRRAGLTLVYKAYEVKDRLTVLF